MISIDAPFSPQNFSLLTCYFRIIFQSHHNGTEIEVATRLWISPTFTASTNYLTALQSYYGTDIRQINFGKANDVANVINSWVRDNTRNNIKSIVQPGI